MGAFEQARAQGAKAVELDVRTCARGEVVVFHDATLERMTGKRRRELVADLASTELGTLDLGGATVPLLSAVLAWARQRQVAVNVELKHDVPNRWALAVETVRVVREAGADVLFSSFDPLLMTMVGALAPGIPRALLFHSAQPRWVDVLQHVVRPPLVSTLHLERTQATDGGVRGPKDRNLRVGVWTVNDPAEARALVARGATTVITDQPGAILAGLGAA
jgi:glycerophosphoryl diester phosphodiesterase